MTGPERRDWREHWRNVQRSPSTDIGDALVQVGKTVLGRPVGQEQIDAISARIVRFLDLAEGVKVMDIGCGNGIITAEVARSGSIVTGIDVSSNLIDDATQHRKLTNITYEVADITQLGFLNGDDRSFDRFYSYEVVQHLTRSETGSILRYLAERGRSTTRIFLGSIPDAARIRSFYDTPERWNRYLRKKADGTEQIGTWWERSELEEVALESGFAVSTLDQPPMLYTAHYRFDALLWK